MKFAATRPTFPIQVGSYVKLWEANLRKQQLRVCHLDTSDKSKGHSKEALEELGGDETLEAHRNKPISKDAAENLYGSRATAA